MNNKKSYIIVAFYLFMKICVISDSHGDRDIIRKIYNQNLNCDIYLHLGDSQLDESLIYPFVGVRGNCDYFSDLPAFKIITTPYGKIYLEHGHIHKMVTVSFLRKYDCKIYLYGHTHIKKVDKIDEYYFFNPGSVSLPRDGDEGTYLIKID